MLQKAWRGCFTLDLQLRNEASIAVSKVKILCSPLPDTLLELDNVYLGYGKVQANTDLSKWQEVVHSNKIILTLNSIFDSLA